jgi:TetR/AcrR family transcriptional regulator
MNVGLLIYGGLETVSGGYLYDRKLVEYLQRWYESFISTPASGIPKLMVAEATNFPELGRFYQEEVVRRGQRLIARILQRGIERGEFRPVNVEHAVRLAVSPILHYVIMRHSLHACTGEKVDARAVLELHLELFLRGIAQVPDPEVRP